MIFNTLLHLLLSYINHCLYYYLQSYLYAITYITHCLSIFVE